MYVAENPHDLAADDAPGRTYRVLLIDDHTAAHQPFVDQVNTLDASLASETGLASAQTKRGKAFENRIGKAKQKDKNKNKRKEKGTIHLYPLETSTLPPLASSHSASHAVIWRRDRIPKVYHRYLPAVSIHGLSGLTMIREAEQSDQPFAVVVLDINGLSGDDAIAEISDVLSADQHLQLIIVSAGLPVSRDKMVQATQGADRVTLLRTPCNPDELLYTITVCSARWYKHLTAHRQLKSLDRDRLQLQDIINNTTSSVALKNRDGVYIMVNQRFAQLMGRDDIIGKRDEELFPADICLILHSKEVAVWSSHTPIEMQEADPRIPDLRFLTTRFRLCDQQGEPYALCTISQDLTDYLSLEEQLRQAQKMEAVGRLASSIAHDFNNLLAAINGYSELIIEFSDKSSQQHNMAQQILNAGNQAASLTQQMLAFGRRQVLRPELIDVSSFIEQQSMLFKSMMPTTVTLQVDIAKHLAPIFIDPSQLNQVMVNLVVNACDAVDKEGVVTISARPTHSEEDDSSRLELSVRDNGSGMSSDVLEMIWEPFYSTKGKRGTGLGLSTVMGIIKQSGGEIVCRSTLGEGTSMVMSFPTSAGLETDRYEALKVRPQSKVMKRSWWSTMSPPYSRLFPPCCVAMAIRFWRQTARSKPLSRSLHSMGRLICC